MSLVDSTAAFHARCNEIDDTGQLAMVLSRQGITSFSSMAFAMGTPNQPPTDAVFDAFAVRLFVAPSMGQVGKLRRLLFESQTYVLAQLKLAVTGDQTAGAKKLPLPEKQARLEDLKARLNGVVLEGEREPAHSLIDLCQTIYETGNIVWIHPSKCKKRDSEVRASVKDPKQILKVESQMIKLEQEVVTEAADHGTELKLMWCFQRRGLALDMTNVVSWSAHERWIDTLFRAYAADAAQTTRAVSLAQLIKADCEMWTMLARECRSVKPDAHGAKPLDLMMERLQSDPRIVVHLMPQPIGRSSGSEGGGRKNEQDSDKPDPKKKRPGKRARTAPNVPEELKDAYQQTADGKPICWAFNLSGGCKSKAGGKPPSCHRGAHVCAFCRKVGHGYQTCRNVKRPAENAASS